MTVTVGRTQINLGWPAAGSIVLFLIGITWQLAVYFTGFINSQHEMQHQLAAIAKRDSIYFSKVDDQSGEIANLKKSTDSIKELLGFTGKPRQVSYYTERKVNGRVVLTTVNN